MISKSFESRCIEPKNALLYKLTFNRFSLTTFCLCNSHCFHLFTRLRKELEVHKEGELELLREALTSEIQFLQSVSCCVMKRAFVQPNKSYLRYDTVLHILQEPAPDRGVALLFTRKRSSNLIHAHKKNFKIHSYQSLFFSGFVGFHSVSLFCCLQKLDSSQGSEQH